MVRCEVDLLQWSFAIHMYLNKLHCILESSIRFYVNHTSNVNKTVKEKQIPKEAANTAYVQI